MYKVDKLLTGITTQQNGTTAQWYSNKTSLNLLFCIRCSYFMKSLFMKDVLSYAIAKTNVCL